MKSYLALSALSATVLAAESMAPDSTWLALANFGGIGVLAAVLFYLHTSTARAYREDLAAERRQCHEDHLAMNELLREQNKLLLTQNELLRTVLESNPRRRGQT